MYQKTLICVFRIIKLVVRTQFFSPIPSETVVLATIMRMLDIFQHSLQKDREATSPYSCIGVGMAEICGFVK